MPEDPARSSQTGRIERLRPRGIRVDAGVEEGDEVGTRYDPMIAKLVAHGQTREESSLHARSLAKTEVGGLTTNLPFCAGSSRTRRCARETTTAFLDEYPPLSLRPRACRKGRGAAAGA